MRSSRDLLAFVTARRAARRDGYDVVPSLLLS
jgi:hypothetical protein